MGWSTRHSRLRKIKDHLLNVGRPVVAAEGSETVQVIEREVLAYELNAYALFVERRGHDLQATAAACRERLAGLNVEQREAVFDLARQVFKPLAGGSATEGRQVLEALIAAVKVV